MKYKHLCIFIFILLLVAVLPACTRSIGPAASNGKTAGSTSDNANGASGDVMSQLQLLVTQTAMAMQVQSTGFPTTTVTISQTVAGPGETPVPGATPVAGAEVPPAANPGVVVVVPTPTPGLPKVYVLQQGEHPYCIARRFNVNPGEMLSLSGMGGNTVLRQGTELKIPQNGNPFPSARSLRPHPTTYTVAANETIYSIACQFGDVDPNAIIFANQLKSPYTVESGQTLQIP
jgi:LysM repeat protein